MPNYAGVYVFEVTGTTGTYSDVTTSITFTLNLINPCPISSLTLKANPFPAQSEYVLRDTMLELPWINEENLVSNLDTMADCGDLKATFFYD